jgi:3-dehydroquinate synthase
VTTVIPVTGESAYDVVVGRDLDDAVLALVSGADQVVTVADAAVLPHAERIADLLRRSGWPSTVVALDGGEQVKRLDVAGSLWRRLGELRVTRNDVVLAVGGGATTDCVGFVAATWLRGIRCVNLPTTLLGMVDAAIGGKTGINTAAGKNLVGAFHPPAGVVVDLALLDSLPDTEWVNGMAEVVKAGFIADEPILELVEDQPDAARSARGPHTRELVERAIRVKATVVSVDLREAGPREALNYGHTLGHAVERREDYRMPHGHAVSIGLVFAAALGQQAGRLPDAVARRHRDVLCGLGLPTRYDAAAWPALLETMRVDKKARGRDLRFVVLDGIGRPGILEAPDDALLERAYEEVAG